MRFDSGFWSNTTIATLERLGVGYTMGVRMVKSVHRATSMIDEAAWTPIDYAPDGLAKVAECTYKGRRLIVRRTRLVGAQATLWPEWRHFAFMTDLQGDAVAVDAFHRSHARVELAIRDLKEGAGLEHVPSGNFSANAAWLLCAALAHNLIRWSALLGELTPADQLVVARTVRTRFFSVPGRLVHRSGTHTLARAAALAMGGSLRPSTRPPPCSATSPALTPPPRSAHRRRPNQALTTDAYHSPLDSHVPKAPDEVTPPSLHRHLPNHVSDTRSDGRSVVPGLVPKSGAAHYWRSGSRGFLLVARSLTSAEFGCAS